MDEHGSCVHGQKAWLLIQSCSVGMEHLHLWFSFAKRKQKSKGINRKHAFGWFCQHLSKPLRRFQAIEPGTVLHKLVQNSWCQMFRKYMPMTAGKLWRSPLPCKGAFCNVFAVRIGCNSMALGASTLSQHGKWPSVLCV